MLAAEIAYVVGIDVAKQSHTVCLLDTQTEKIVQRPRTITATAEGYRALNALLQKWGTPATILIGLEATGCLWEPLYDALTAAGYTVWVLNPRQTASWATSLGLRAKTDGLDAQTLARGLCAGYARASTLPAEAVQELRALTRARRDLIQSQTAAKQRLRDELVVLFPELPAQTPDGCALFAPAMLHLLEHFSSAQALRDTTLEDVTAVLQQVSDGHWGPEQAQALSHLAQTSAAGTRAVEARGVVVRTMAGHLRDLQHRVADLETAIAAVLKHDEPSNHLRTAPGVGPVIAATVRAELGDVTRFQTVDQVVAYAGLDPRTRQSGAFVGQKRVSKHGPGALRHALYLATLVAVRTHPEWQVRYQRLLDRGRPKKEALTILSRALLKVLYHLLRTGTSYDPAAISLSKPCPAPGTA